MPGSAATTPHTSSDLVSLVGGEAVRRATAEDRVDGLVPSVVVEPFTTDQAAAVMAWARARGVSVLPRGGGARMDWGNPPMHAGIVLSTRRLSAVVEHAAGDQTATVQAGVTLGSLQRTLRTSQQMLALDPPFAERSTLGGLIATDAAGALRLRYGGMRDLLIGVTVVRADGVIARGGGKVVKNVAGYDLPKLFTGALGTLGLVIEATVRLHPRPGIERTLAFGAAAAEDACRLMLEVLGAQVVPTGLAIRWRGGDMADLLARFGGTESAVAEQVATLNGLAHSCRCTGSADEGATDGAVWDRWSEAAWIDGEQVAVARIGTLPSDMPALLQHVRQVSEGRQLRPDLVMYGHGLGTLRLEADRASATHLADALIELRQRLQRQYGTCAVLRAPLDVKRRLGDVWGIAPELLPLMRRVKEQFDPAGILNPDRLLPAQSPSSGPA